MSDLKKVWVVTSGSYSDYGINAIFSSKEVAVKYAERLGSECNGAEEWPIDEDIEAIMSNRRRWDVRLDKERNVVKVEMTESMYDGGVSWDRNRNWIVTVWGDSEEQAIKAANERVTQAIAGGMVIP